jgi:hypothetical protein
VSGSGTGALANLRARGVRAWSQARQRLMNKRLDKIDTGIGAVERELNP